MDDLTAFLTARIDEDEAIARKAGEGHWKIDCYCVSEYNAERLDQCGGDCCRIEGEDIIIYDEGGHGREQAIHIALHDPARVLREVAAKKKILWRHTPDTNGNCSNCVSGYGPSSTGEVYYEEWPCWHMRTFASAYFDHEEFRNEWLN